MLKFVTVGDLHLDKKRLVDLMGSNAIDLQLSSVKDVLRHALRKDIKHVFFLGDVSDSTSLSDYAEQQLIKLLLAYDKKLNIHIILGNHDIKQKDVHSLCKISLLSKTKKLESVYVYDKHVVKKLDGIDVEFMPYPCSTPKRKYSVCVAHIEVKGSKLDSGFASKDGVDVRPGNLWVIGHLHTKQSDKSRSYFYPGTLYQTSFAETQSKVFMEFDVDKAPSGRLKYTVQKHPSLRKFSLKTVEIKEKHHIDVYKKYLNEDPLTFYRVFHSANISLPLSFMRKYPQVIECKSFKSDQELKDLVVSENIQYKITDGLMMYLKNLGMSLASRKRARSLVKKAINRV